MGKGDQSNKMRQKVEQARKKARVARQTKEKTKGKKGR